MNNNATAIIVLCSHLCVGDGIKPLEPNEWMKMAEKLLAVKYQPVDLLSFSTQDFSTILDLNQDQIIRIQRLIDRSASISFELQKYQNMGISIVTRADAEYPRKLKTTLGKTCPPIFYYVGDISLTNQDLVGFVGSRNINTQDLNFTKSTVCTINKRGYSVVSGGANGVDSVAHEESLINGYFSVDFISDSLVKRLRNKSLISAVQEKRALILSASNPDSGFNTGLAMMRNKFIYAQSVGTVVVKADYDKGGTWSGAVENIKNQWCPTFCWSNPEYPGNVALIDRGAIAIDKNWDGSISDHKMEKVVTTEQLSLFDK